MNEIDKESTPQEMPTHTKGVDDWFEYIDALDDWRSSLGRGKSKDAYSIEYASFGMKTIRVLDHRDINNSIQDINAADVTISDFDENK